jgi:hypothetical protein
VLLRRRLGLACHIDDAQDREILAMPVGALIALPALFLEHHDLLAAGLLEQFGGDGCTLDDRRADLGVLAVVEHQHRRDRQGATCFAFELFDGNHIAIGDAILLPAGLNHCVHVPHPLCRGHRATPKRGLTSAECSSKNKADRE